MSIHTSVPQHPHSDKPAGNSSGPSGITIAAQAAQHIALRGRPLRIRVKGGGCSGMRYVFAFEHADQTSDRDLCFAHDNGACIVVDPLSYVFLEGGTLDYQSELLASSFVFHNPKATNACGCGDSFSVF